MANIITTLLTAHGFKKTAVPNDPKRELWELTLKDDKRETSIKVNISGWFGFQTVQIFIKPTEGDIIENNFVYDNIILSIFKADEWLYRFPPRDSHPAYTAITIFEALTKELNLAVLENNR